MKRFLVLLVALVLLGSAALAAQDTPEAVMQAFTAAVAAGDFEEALNLCSSRQKALNHDWEMDINRVRAYTPSSMTPPAPNYEQHLFLNEAIVQGRMAQNIYMFVVSFFSEDGLSGSPYVVEDESWVGEYMEAVNPANLEGLQLIALGDPDMYDNENIIENFTTQAAVYGADEKIEKIAFYELDGRVFVGSYTLLRYGDAWYVEALYSTLLGQSAYGSVIEIPQERVEEFMDELGMVSL